MNRSPRELIELFDITAEHQQLIQKLKEPITAALPELLDEFYAWMSDKPEYEEFFSDDGLLQSVREKQHEYWEQFFDANYDDEYFDRRAHLGTVHARIGLPIDIYMAGMDHILSLFVGVIDSLDLTHVEYQQTRRAINLLMHVDCTLTILSYQALVAEQISAQSKTLIAMSTPVTKIWDGILLLPLVGIIDSKRAQDIMFTTLEKIRETAVRSFILDISGVAVVDTAVANHLIKITKATRMMGCESIISGVSPNIAQTIVDLGIDVGSVKTTGDMRSAMELALARVDMRIAPRS